MALKPHVRRMQGSELQSIRTKIFFRLPVTVQIPDLRCSAGLLVYS